MSGQAYPLRSGCWCVTVVVTVRVILADGKPHIDI